MHFLSKFRLQTPGDKQPCFPLLFISPTTRDLHIVATKQSSDSQWTGRALRKGGSYTKKKLLANWAYHLSHGEDSTYRMLPPSRPSSTVSSSAKPTYQNEGPPPCCHGMGLAPGWYIPSECRQVFPLLATPWKFSKKNLLTLNED